MQNILEFFHEENVKLRTVIRVKSPLQMGNENHKLVYLKSKRCCPSQ